MVGENDDVDVDVCVDDKRDGEVRDCCSLEFWDGLA